MKLVLSPPGRGSYIFLYTPIAVGAHILIILIRITAVIIVVKRSKLPFIECVYEPGVMLSALHALFNTQKNPGWGEILLSSSVYRLYH